jgi:hypothetical protein
MGTEDTAVLVWLERTQVSDVCWGSHTILEAGDLENECGRRKTIPVC